MSARGRRAYGGLYRRLTVSYMLVTLLVALLIVVAVGVAEYVAQAQRQPETISSARTLSARAAQVEPFLNTPTPDVSHLAGDVLPSLVVDLQRNGNWNPTLVVILDRAAHVLASASCQGGSARAGNCRFPAPTDLTSAILSSSAVAEIGSVLASNPPVVNATQPGQAGAAYSFQMQDQAGQTLTVVPVVSGAGLAVGALAVAGDVTSPAEAPISQNPETFIIQYLARLTAIRFIPIVLLTIVVGTLAGVLISRTLTRRLHTISQAAEAWSRGDFQIAVRDGSRDELGQLGRDLNHMAQQVQALLVSREELAVIEERNRLARDLHDSVKQHVFAGALLVHASRTLAGQDPASAAVYLQQAEDLAEQTQTELVELIRALRPAAIADKGLVAALRDEADEWSRRTGIGVSLRIEGQRETPLDSEEALLRVSQEALANVARHSEATTVEIALRWESAHVVLVVRDDGRGFDPLRTSGEGLGITSMRERLEAIGGTLLIESSSGGTRIEASAPIPRNTMRAPLGGDE